MSSIKWQWREKWVYFMEDDGTQVWNDYDPAISAELETLYTAWRQSFPTNSEYVGPIADFNATTRAGYRLSCNSNGHWRYQIPPGNDSDPWNSSGHQEWRRVTVFLD